MRIRHDFYLSWASSQALASFLSTEKPMHHRLLCEVWSLILSGISPPICSNPKKHVLATGIRSLTNEPAPLQVTICQVPPPHPLSFSVPQQGAQQPDPPGWKHSSHPALTPRQTGACSLFCSFIEVGRATAFRGNQWLGFSYSDDPMSGRALTLLPKQTSLPRFDGPFSSVGTERDAGGRREESGRPPGSPRSAVQRSPVLKCHQACYCEWPWSPAGSRSAPAS